MTATKTPRPEAVHLMLLAWLGVSLAEIIHQALQVSISLANRDILIAGIRKSLEDNTNPLVKDESMVSLAASMSIFGAAIISLLFIMVLLFMLRRLASQHKWAGSARRMWFAFSLYFGVRVMFVFMASPAGGDAPDWLVVGDGMVQIVIGVMAVVGLIFSTKEEVLEYTGELAQIREMEKELKKSTEDKKKKKKKKK